MLQTEYYYRCDWHFPWKRWWKKSVPIRSKTLMKVSVSTTAWLATTESIIAAGLTSSTWLTVSAVQSDPTISMDVEIAPEFKLKQILPWKVRPRQGRTILTSGDMCQIQKWSAGGHYKTRWLKSLDWQMGDGWALRSHSSGSSLTKDVHVGNCRS